MLGRDSPEAAVIQCDSTEGPSRVQRTLDISQAWSHEKSHELVRGSVGMSYKQTSAATCRVSATVLHLSQKQIRSRKLQKDLSI